MIDLHIHTNLSDGAHSPKEVVDLAIKKGLKVIAITDHDVIDGVQEAIDYAKDKNMEIVPGIEISCDESKIGFKEVHVLGLFVDCSNKELVKFTEDIKKARIEQKRVMIKKLQQFGFDITFEEVMKQVGASFGRPHVAKLLIKRYPQEFSSIREVFEKYIGIGKPAYADRENKGGMEKAIRIIKKAGGIPFLAHPGVFKKEDSMELIKTFVDLGGQGIETYYPYHLICPQLKIDKKENLELIRFYQDVTKSMRLLESGGSDFHGGDRDTLGKIGAADEILVKLKASLNTISFIKRDGIINNKVN